MTDIYGLGICKQKTSRCHSRAGGNPWISLALEPGLYFNATPLVCSIFNGLASMENFACASVDDFSVKG
jgi:hypothetical protein